MPKPHHANSGNRGATSLKRRKRSENPMQDYDRLPPELRIWLAGAVLPWRPSSVRRTFDKLYRRTRDRAKALQELDRIERQMIAKDAGKIWGDQHPSAQVL